MTAPGEPSRAVPAGARHTDAGSITRPSLAELGRYFLRLGAAGFGGPIALVGYMEREFVERRHWASAEELKDGIAFAQLAPGPLAAQLAIYLGWLSAGARGATVAGFAFVAPSFLMVVVLAAFYVRFGGMPWLQGAFYGIGAAVIAIIARSAVKLARTTVAREPLLMSIFGAMAIVTAWREAEIVWLFILCGVLAVLIRTPPSSVRAMAVPFVPASVIQQEWVVTAIYGGAPIAVLVTLFLYFASAGLFVFGSGLAIVPFLHGGVVQQHQWLSERQFLDAVAVALITPGPVVITVAFIGYLVAGVLGATVAALGVFAPVYVITVVFAPYFDRLKANCRVRAFIDGVTAAATGAIAGAAFVLGRRAIIDGPTTALLAGTLLVLLTARRIPEPLVIVAAGVIGFAVKGLS